jgi:hypothetical protein
MQWTSIKDIVSRRVCKWKGANSPAIEMPDMDSAMEESERRTRLRILPDMVILATMAGLLLLASLRSSFHAFELLVTWGNDGSLPAVCHSSRSLSGARQFTILCPGGDSAANQLLFELNKRGCRKLESVFVSSAAPASYGGRLLLRKKPVSSLVQLLDSRLQKPALDLLAEARFSGSVTRQASFQPEDKSKRHQHWEFSSRREKNGDLLWSFYHLREQLWINLRWQKNGLLELKYWDRQANISRKQFPRRNRCGAWSSSESAHGDSVDWPDDIDEID